MELVRTNMQLRADQHERLRVLAHERRMSMSELIREAIDATYGEKGKEGKA